MSRTVRLTLAAGAVTLGLALAGPALASYAPKLIVSADQNGAVKSLTINFTQGSADDPSAQLKFYVPAGTTATLGQAAGSTLGTLTAQAAAADLGGATLPLSGFVQAADGSTAVGGATPTVNDAATVCTGTTAHTAFWLLVLQAAGQTLKLPLYVDQLVSTDATAAFAGYTITACLPPPDVPAGTPGRATFGAKVFQAIFTLNNVFAGPASGDARWRMTATPYTPATGKANAAGTLELQSIVSYPLGITLAAPKAGAKAAGKVSFKLAGTLTAPAGAAPAVTAWTGATAKALKTAGKLAASGGKLSGTVSIAAGKKASTAYVAAQAKQATKDLGASACQATFGLPCAGATKAGFTLVSAPQKVAVPAA